MNSPGIVRREYGRTFVSVFEDDLIIPWKPLSIGEYLRYAAEIAQGRYTLAMFEDEIFRLCVTDDIFTSQMDFLKAGVIHEVATHIWQHSGPTSIESANQDLDIARHLLVNGSGAVLNELVQYVTLAFPYLPEQVYEMDYKTLLTRVVQAERKLMMMGMTEEPIVFTNPTKQPKKRRKIRKDLKKMFERQEGINEKTTDRDLLDNIPREHNIDPLEGTPRDKWWKESPILEATDKHNINFKLEGQAQDMCLTGWEREDEFLLRDKMIKDAQIIYKDVIEKLKKKNDKKE